MKREKPVLDIIDACEDREAFAQAFKDPATFATWFVFLRAMFALEMSEADLEIYRRHTGRTDPPQKPFRFVWLVVGRRGGKSLMLAIIIVFLALYRDYTKHLQVGEKAVLLVMAADRGQAKKILGYVKGLLLSSEVFSDETDDGTADTVTFKNRPVIIEVGTASYRSVRGGTIAAAVLDEIAFFRAGDTSANPDHEIVAALRPGMASIPNAVLIGSSSPYKQEGVLFQAHQKHHGVNDAPQLVWQADTRSMNPTIPQEEINDALQEDYARYSAEYLAEFRKGLASFVDRDVVQACVDKKVFERPYEANTRYFAYADAATGSGQDSFCLCIAHRVDDIVVVDVVKERKPPFSPSSLVRDYAELLKSYRIYDVRGDKYAAGFNVELWRQNGINYRYADNTTSQNYLDLLPVINAGRVRLLDIARVVEQIASLERRVQPSGRDQVTHPTRGHDDAACAVAGAVSLVATKRNARAVIASYGSSNTTPYRNIVRRSSSHG